MSVPSPSTITIQALLQSLLAFLGSLYIRLIGITSRVLWVNRISRDKLESTGKGFIYACWHGRQMFLLYLHETITRVH